MYYDPLYHKKTDVDITFREACWTTALSQNISSRKSARNFTITWYPFYVIPSEIYTRICWNIINYICTFFRFFAVSFPNLMSSSESKLEQDSQSASDSFSERSRKKLAGLRPFIRA
ncbi:hypothetical protein TNCV_4295811 [Trichonephila clavipes]|nr:hypothetical protein TNCV_4295811 [Trichonephila clavipes]